MDLVLSTEAVPDREKLDYWRDAIGRALVPMAVVPRGGRPLGGRITGGRLGHLRVCSVEADAQRISRTAAHIDSPSEAFVAVHIQVAGTATLLQDGRHAAVGAGELVVYDTARPYTLDFPEPFASRVVHLPRRSLGVPDEHIRGITATPVSATEGLGAILTPFLATLVGSAHSYPPAVAGRLAVSVVDLFGTLVAERSRFGCADSAREHLVLRIRDHIDRHLEDQELAPESVAAAHHISVRYLHRLFEEEGITVARLIQRRRLQECARELARGGSTAPAVAAVGQRWGFVNPAHFSRVFRGAYGHSPREWRRLRTAGVLRDEESGGTPPAAVRRPNATEGDRTRAA
ncbi:helix-turn-helix domain-containing protein [Streptomyces sp. NPDC048521]|uniref:AraC-like ligand-binding domain-containing protein n=1 Tax=Streptomyces sp. NPDC048521 TaxID=3365566 RepID=UPI003721F708